MDNKAITIAQALNSQRDFYAKIWQGNGFYPIEKYVYHKDTDEFEQFVNKISGWRSWGVPKGGDVTNKNWLKYIFEHNSCILSFNEMKDEHNYNVE